MKIVITVDNGAFTQRAFHQVQNAIVYSVIVKEPADFFPTSRQLPFALSTFNLISVLRATWNYIFKKQSNMCSWPFFFSYCPCKPFDNVGIPFRCFEFEIPLICQVYYAQLIALSRLFTHFGDTFSARVVIRKSRQRANYDECWSICFSPAESRIMVATLLKG